MARVATGIEKAAASLVATMTSADGPEPELSLAAATPLDTLPPDLVALVVGRVRAGATAFGDDHPRSAVTGRIVVPSLVLAVLDLVGLIAAAATGQAVLAVLAAVLLVLLAGLALAGNRFVRDDPLRVSADQRARVSDARRWSSHQRWTADQRNGPWGRLVGAACSATGRIAGSDAWTWASTATQREQTQLGGNLHAVDSAAYGLNAVDAVPAATGNSTAADIVRRVAALQLYADGLDDLVRRATRDADLRNRLPAIDAERLGTLIDIARGTGVSDAEPVDPSS